MYMQIILQCMLSPTTRFWTGSCCAMLKSIIKFNKNLIQHGLLNGMYAVDGVFITSGRLHAVVALYLLPLFNT